MPHSLFIIIIHTYNLTAKVINPKCQVLSAFTISVYIRGRSDKHLAYKRKTKILEKWRFISQHSLILARYT